MRIQQIFKALKYINSMNTLKVQKLSQKVILVMY